jgi:hypothetical protein
MWGVPSGHASSAEKQAILVPSCGDLDVTNGCSKTGSSIPEVAPTGPVDATDFTFWVKTEPPLPSPCAARQDPRWNYPLGRP